MSLYILKSAAVYFTSYLIIFYPAYYCDFYEIIFTYLEMVTKL